MNFQLCHKYHPSASIGGKTRPPFLEPFSHLANRITVRDIVLWRLIRLVNHLATHTDNATYTSALAQAYQVTSNCLKGRIFDGY